MTLRTVVLFIMDVVELAIDFVMHMTMPWVVIGIALTYIPQAVATILSSGHFSKFFSPSDFLSVLFGTFWTTFGPNLKEDTAPRVIPLLEGRVQDGEILDAPVCEPISGVVVEVGAGNGMWVDVLASIAGVKPAGDDSDSDSDKGIDSYGDKAADTIVHRHKSGAPSSGITKIYGVEPNEISAASLRERVHENGLDGIYEVVPVGIERVADPTAWDGEIPLGSVDCIVCICCLCSIPNQEENIKYLYKLLKPGGRWYIHEHVQATRGGMLLRLYQYYFGFFYGIFMGGCRLCRPTLKNILAAGPFTEINVGQPEGEPSYQLIPWVMGVLKK